MTAHAECKHQNTKTSRANCRRIRNLVAGFTSLSDEELSAAMRAGTKVTGWTVYDDAALDKGVVIREITGVLDYVETNSKGVKIWRIRFQIDPTGKTCSPALESSCNFPASRIRLAV